MTRKHFVQIAQLLKDTKASIKTIEGMAEICLQDNPNFDTDRFIIACMENSKSD